MRRQLVLATTAAAAIGAVTAGLPAHAATGRTVKLTYTAATTAMTPNGQVHGSGVVVQGLPGAGSYGLTFIKLHATERRASIRMDDRTGRVVQALVQQTARDGSVTTIGTFCGSTRHPLRLAPGGGELVVRPSYGMCGQEPSVPTTGELRVTLR